jgi:hypothetical protein
MKNISIKWIARLLACLSVAVIMLSFPINDTFPGLKAENSSPADSKLMNRAGEEINWYVFSNGGVNSGSVDFHMKGTMGQSVIGLIGSPENQMIIGFWQNFIMICDCEPGEADGVPPINILDIVYLINYKYKGGSAAEPYEICNGDPTCDCEVNILDIVYLINFKYKNGPDPCACEDWTAQCGSLQK